MEYVIDVISEPAQSFTTRLGGKSLSVSLSTYKGVTYANVFSEEDGSIVNGARCVSGVNILPKAFSESIGGELYFEDSDGQYPNYERFNGIDCVLVFREYGG